MLIKSRSRAAVGKNIATEISAGKPRDQAIAIALDVQRRAGGGTVVKGPRSKVGKAMKNFRGL